jgi:hypothetical protein
MHTLLEIFMRISSLITWLFSIGCVGAKGIADESTLIGESDRPAWDPDPQTISNGSSSSDIAWTPPDEESGPEPDHYFVTVTSEFGNVVYENKTSIPSIQLTNLRTDTEYNISIDACYDEDCTNILVGEPVQPAVWRTEIEDWNFPQISGESISPLISNAYAPTLINLSELPVNQDGWVLTTIQNDGWSQQVQISTMRELFMDDSDNTIEFVMETPLSVGVQDVPNIIDFTSSSARPIQIDGEWTLQLFISLKASERSMLGSWTSDAGVDQMDLSDEYGGLCEMSSVLDTCGMNTCMDSHAETSITLNRIDCISLIPNTDGFMLMQGRADSADNTPPNLYIAQGIGNGEWAPLGNQVATPLLKDATGGSVSIDGGIGKLYYWDENSGAPYVRYWDPTHAGDASKLELEDLEGEDRIRHVYYTDRTGEVMPPWHFKVVERTFLSHNSKKIMLATVETDSGERHITFGVLTNP